MIVDKHLFDCQQFGCDARCIMRKWDGMKLDLVRRKVGVATSV
jgi:hypothetical protein